MKIYTKDGMELPFKQFTFPDGQRHFQFEGQDSCSDLDVVTIETAIRNGDELLDVLLAKDALNYSRYAVVNLYIRYLLAARMDRPIGTKHPFTLQIVGDILRAARFNRIQVLDPHSDVSGQKLHASARYPLFAVAKVLSNYRSDETVLVAPDKGATNRVNTLLKLLGATDVFQIAQGLKKRDPHTGQLTGFDVVDRDINLFGKTCLILDDICDGGGTFSGLAKVLREHGARGVDLFVTHGIFSKGGKIEGLDLVYTTDSYRSAADMPKEVTVIPVSMKD